MILEWRLGNISACFSYLDNFCIGIWDECVDAIVAELGRFMINPLCGILLSGHPYIVLCILSRILGHLHVVVVEIEYY